MNTTKRLGYRPANESAIAPAGGGAIPPAVEGEIPPALIKDADHARRLRDQMDATLGVTIWLKPLSDPMPAIHSKATPLNILFGRKIDVRSLMDPCKFLTNLGNTLKFMFLPKRTHFAPDWRTF